jgi:hypothetical protein
MTTALTKISGIGPSTAKVLTENAFESAQQLADTTIALLSKVPGFSAVRASRTIKAANALLSVSVDASAISTIKTNATQTTMQQRRPEKKPAPGVADSASVPATDTKADADTNEPEVEEGTGKEQGKAAKRAAKKVKRAAKKVKRVAKKVKKAEKVKKAKKAAKKAAKKVAKAKKKAAKAKKKAKTKARSKKNKK